MARSLFVRKYLSVLLIAAAALALLVPIQAMASSGGGGGYPSISQPSSNGTTITLSGSGFTPGGVVDVLEKACFWTSCTSWSIVASPTANGFHYVCRSGYCYRVYGDFTTQFPASPCYPYSVEYYARDETSGADSNLTNWALVC